MITDVDDEVDLFAIVGTGLQFCRAVRRALRAVTLGAAGYSRISMAGLHRHSPEMLW
jgi:hypothetical protein